MKFIIKISEYPKHSKGGPNKMEGRFKTMEELSAATARNLKRMKAAGSDYKVMLFENEELIQSFSSENYKKRSA